MYHIDPWYYFTPCYGVGAGIEAGVRAGVELVLELEQL
jgi:hypothetical protein